jgi:pentatricopeptide repeat protein
MPQEHGLQLGFPALMELLKQCGKRKDAGGALRLHKDMAGRGLLEKNPCLASALISVYCKCGMPETAQKLLEELPARDVVAWTSLISGYARLGDGRRALRCFASLRKEGLVPNEVTLACALKACGIAEDVEQGREIHDEVIAMGLLEKHVVLGNALIDMYAKCGSLRRARQVLDDLPIRNVVSWNALIAGCSQQEQGHEALTSFTHMQREGLSPDEVTFTCILKACGSIRSVEKGKQIHLEIINIGLLQNNAVLGNALVDMYAKCGVLDKAQKVLEDLPARNVISWNALIAGFIQHKKDKEALDCFAQMQRDGLVPNEVTFSCILTACGSIGAIDQGKQIHYQIASTDLIKKNILLSTALLDMYAKCGMFTKAQQLLEELPVRDVVCWSALIAGYAQEDRSHEALDCFEQMQREGLSPNEITFSCVLKACGSIGALDKGQQIHNEILIRRLLDKNVVLGSALVDMYARCAALNKAQEVLEELPVRDTVAWNALLSGYAQEGYCDEALNTFQHMVCEGLTPNEITFTGVLSACSHSGNTTDAQTYYETMNATYGIAPNLKHDTCMVVVLGCLGCLEKAISVINTLPSSDDPSVWLTLLGACRTWGNVDLAKFVFNRLIQLDANLAAAYILMANIYATAGMKEEAEKVQAMSAKRIATWKVPRTSLWVDLNGNIHSFPMTSSEHPQMKHIYEELQKIYVKMPQERCSEQNRSKFDTQPHAYSSDSSL